VLLTASACSSTFGAADSEEQAGAGGTSGDAGASSGGKGGSGGTGGSSETGGSGGTGTGGTGGSGGTDTGGTSGSGGTGGVVAGCVQYVESYCAWAARCDEYLFGGSLSACQGIADEQCAWLELPGIAITGPDYARCATSYDAASCEDVVETCELPNGTIASGFACATSQQCESGYCTAGGGACGTCAPNPRHEAGGACDEPVFDCVEEMDCIEGECTPRRREGESCDDVHTCEADRELGALVCIDGICTVAALPGDPCLMTESMSTYCGSGTACTTENVCVLVEEGDEGDVCGTFADRVVGCPDGSCETDPNDPETAHCMNWAQGGEPCDKVPGFLRCATGLSCQNSICVWPPIPAPPEDCE